MNNERFDEILRKRITSRTYKFGEQYLKGKRPVFLCLPYDGDTETYVCRLKKAMKLAEDAGCALLAPYLLIEEATDLDVFTLVDFVRDSVVRLIDICDEFWLYPAAPSENVQAELSLALRLNKKIMYLNELEETDNE